MMKRIFAFAIALMFVTSTSFAAVGAGVGAKQGTGSISGTARSATQQALSGVRVQLRNVDTGQIAGSTTSSATGGYSFTGLNAGNYVVEIVDASGRIIGVSASMGLAAGGTISGVTIAASAAGAIGGAAAAAGATSFFTTTGGILVLAAVGGGLTAGILALTNNASASR